MAFIVKNTTFPSLLDLLAPHSCRGCGRLGEPLCECCKNHIIAQIPHICPNCKRPLPRFESPKPAKKPLTFADFKCPHCDLPPVIIVGGKSGPLGPLIHDYKYDSVRALARPLSELLASALPADTKNIVLVPLPTATNHIRARAFDHTYLIAKHLAREKGYKLEKLLLRAKNTVQVGTDSKTRKQQAASAYRLNEKLKLDPTKTYLLLDDVWTTGASMTAAINLLKENGAEYLAAAVLAVNKLA